MSRKSDPSKGPSPLLQTAVFGALGMQFVATVLVTYFFGDWIDAKNDTSPWGVVISMGLGLVGSGIHTYHITKRFVASNEDEEIGD